MSKINLTLPEGEEILVGKQVTFKAPCNCSSVSALVVEGLEYTLVSSCGSSLSATPDVFSSGSFVSVLLDPQTAKAYILNSSISTGVKTINGDLLKFFVGTKDKYNELTNEDKRNVFAIITDDTTKDELFGRMDEVEVEVQQLKADIDNGNVNAISLYSNKYIAADSDFNDFIYFGNYTCVDNATFHTLKNAPPNGSAGSLKVISGTGGCFDIANAPYLYLLQVYISLTGNMYIRTMTRENGVWTYGTWMQFAGQGSKATNADYATSAGNASTATNADYATKAGSAQNASIAVTASNADRATTATNASLIKTTPTNMTLYEGKVYIDLHQNSVYVISVLDGTKVYTHTLFTNLLTGNYTICSTDCGVNHFQYSAGRLIYQPETQHQNKNYPISIMKISQIG